LFFDAQLTQKHGKMRTEGGITMKNKSKLKYIISMLVLLVAVTAWFGTGQAAGAVQRLHKIEASYFGSAVEVGKEIDIKDIYLIAEYRIQDGYNTYFDYVDVKKGFTISPSVVAKEGVNRIQVTYLDKTCTIEVEGKVVESLQADYVGEDLYIGSAIPVGKVEVYANFSDGSFELIRDFTLSQKTVTKEGLNSIPVTYKGKTAYMQVYGKLPLAVEEIQVEHNGNTTIVGSNINKSDFVVTVHYNDGSYKEVTNFNISPSVIKQEGVNEITVSYGEVSAKIEVYGDARVITDMKAKYIGGGVIVGKKVKKEEIEVIVTYNDGTDEQIDNYQILGELIQNEGENLVLVYIDAFMQEIVVRGVKGFAANYDNPISNYFVSPDYAYYSKVTLGMNMEVGADKFLLREADPEMLEYVVQRVASTEQFLGFELFYDDDEMVREFPMAMKVTVPEDFDPEHFSVYYTPNRSTIMAKVVGDFLDEDQTEYEFVVYEPGVYILVNEVSCRLVTEIIVETEIKMKENRSYSLNPVVFPLSAENREVTFTSTDEDVATVSPNGKIRTHSAGTCEIWIEAEDDSGVYVVVTVEVTGKKR